MWTVWGTPSVASTVAQTFAWEEVRIQPSLNLKGQCNEIFRYRLFHESSSPKPPDMTNSVVTNLFEIYSQLKMANGKSEKVLILF
jgi:hypothetical protein